MKKILYLNNDSLSSFMSQMDDGLIKNKTESTKKDIEKGRDIKSTIEAEGAADLKLLGKGLSANLDASIEENNKNSKMDSYINSTEKIIYDEAYERFENYLIKEELINKEGKIGDFVKLDKEMFIVDLDYYKSIFADKSIFNFIVENEIKERCVKAGIGLQATGNDKKKEYEEEKNIKEIKRQVNKEYEEVAKNIELVLKIVPYNKFGIMGDYLVAIDDTYFRDKTKVVAFKYGGEMTLVGYLTNIVNNNEISAETNIFNTFPTIINAFMLSFFKKSEIKILHPIAIYY